MKKDCAGQLKNEDLKRVNYLWLEDSIALTVNVARLLENRNPN